MEEMEVLAIQLMVIIMVVVVAVVHISKLDLDYQFILHLITTL
jgi:hypothetical protein